MNIKKCDICKKEISRGKHVVAGTAAFKVMEVCYDCGAPIVEFLIKNKFIKKGDKKE